MLEEIDTLQTKNSLLFLMASLSPRVADSLNREDYKTSADSDGATEDYILDNSFRRYMLDLQNIGLIFNIETSDYIEDLGKLSRFLDLGCLLLPNSLYNKLKTDSRIKDLIESIVNGSLGDNEPAITIYLTELAGLDGSLPLRPYLSDFIDNLIPLVSQTDIFTDYLKQSLDLYYEERLAGVIDEERHAQYRDRIREFIGDLSDAVNRFESWDIFEDILKVQNMIINDLIVFENFIDYSYLFLESKETLPEDLHERYDNKWYLYKVSHPWCYEYYETRKQEVKSPYTVAIACFVYALHSKSKDAYKQEIKEFRRRYTDPSSMIDSVIFSLYQE